MALGPTHEEVITDLVAHHDLQLPADADHALPDPDQVPQRGAAAVRRAADQRVPDEGRLQLRHLGRGARPQLREDVRGLLPDLRPLRAALPAGRGRERPDRRRRQPRVHDPGRERRGRGAPLPATAATRPTWSRPRSAPATWSRPSVPQEPLKKVATPGRRDHRAGQQVPRLPAAADDQDADLRGRRQADRRAGARRPRRQRGQDPPRGRGRQARPGRPRGDRAGDRRAGRLRRPGRHEGEDPDLRRPRRAARSSTA